MPSGIADGHIEILQWARTVAKIHVLVRTRVVQILADTGAQWPMHEPLVARWSSAPRVLLCSCSCYYWTSCYRPGLPLTCLVSIPHFDPRFVPATPLLPADPCMTSGLLFWLRCCLITSVWPRLTPDSDLGSPFCQVSLGTSEGLLPSRASCSSAAIQRTSPHHLRLSQLATPASLNIALPVTTIT